jgi:hypothetical protein
MWVTGRSQAVAAVLSVAVVGFGGLPQATASESRQAPAPAFTSLQVTVPCAGGPGRIAVRSHRTPDGGTGAVAHLRDLRNNHWYGGIYVDPDPPAENHYRANNGSFDDSLTSPSAWGSPAQGYYTSGDSQVLCFAGGSDAHGVLNAGSDYLIVIAESGRRRLRVHFSIIPSFSQWRFRVRLGRTTGDATVLRQRVPTNDTGIGTATFRDVRGLGRTTRIAVHAHRVGHPDDQLDLLIRRS